MKFMKTIQQILMPGGICILAFPCYHEKARPNAMTWAHINCYSAGEHINIPSFAAIQKIYKDSGLSIRNSIY